MLTLIEPNSKYLKQYHEAYLLSIEKINTGEIKRHDLMFDNLENVDVIQKIKDARDKNKLKPNRVLSYNYFAVDDDKFIGIIHIKTELTKSLLSFGGNIGYGINPKYWRKGYGTELLKIGLIKAKELIIEDRVLITCDDDNFGSIRVIEKNGGVLENKIINHIDNSEIITRRYWIRIR